MLNLVLGTMQVVKFDNKAPSHTESHEYVSDIRTLKMG